MGVQSHRILHQSLSCLKAHHILQHTGGEPLMLKSILYVILFPDAHPFDVHLDMFEEVWCDITLNRFPGVSRPVDEKAGK